MRASLRMSSDKENILNDKFKRKSLSNVAGKGGENNHNLLQVYSLNEVNRMNHLNLLTSQTHTNQSINMHAKLEELTLQH
jgi:hypothetical protein